MDRTTDSPVSQESPSEPSAWNSFWDTNPNAFSVVSPPQQFASLESVDGIFGNQPNDPYRPPTSPSYTIDSRGQDAYQAICTREVGLSVLDGMEGSPMLFSDPSSQGFGAFDYPHDHVLDAGVNYNGAGDDYLDYWLHSELLPMPLADPLGFECGGNESFIPQGQDSFVTGGPYLGGQYSITEQNHSLSLSDAEKLRFLDPEMTTWPNEASFDECFDSAQATPVFSNEVAVVGYTNPLLFPPAGMVGTTQVPAELPPVDVNNLGTQRSSTRKQPASQDYRHEGERTKYNSAAREQTQTTQAATRLCTRPYLYIVKQVMYKSPNVQKGWRLLPSIDFMVREEGRKLEGINLQDALNKRYSYLEGRDDPMFEGEGIGNSISCRAEACGHHVSSKYRARQIKARNHRKERDRVTRQELAYDVAKFLKDHLEKGEVPFYAHFEDIFLVKLHHVAQASWQPEFWYRVHSSASS